MSDESPPNAEDDPFACSLCGSHLGTVKGLSGEEYCDGCQIDIGVMSGPVRCVGCGQLGPAEQMETIDVSPDGDYYPTFEYLCRACDSGQGGGEA